MASSSALASRVQLFQCSVPPNPFPKSRVFAPSTHFPTNPGNQFSRQSLSLSHRSPQIPLTILKHGARIFASALASAPSSTQSPTIPQRELLTGSTRTIATIFAATLSLSHLIFQQIQKIPIPIDAISSIPKPSFCTMGPLFFAVQDRPRGFLNTPLTVVAAGLAKWLDIYSGVLMVRVLLSWFPNIPWERQPLSAIRDLCDPYLNLFRNIIPPIFDTLDVSPLLAFAVLGCFSMILNTSKFG